MGLLSRIVAGILVLAFSHSVAIAQEAPASPTAAQAIASQPATAATLPVPTLDDFLAEPPISDIALAPGGGLIALVQEQDGLAYLVIKDLKTGAKAATKLGAIQVYGLKWLGNDRLIYSAGSRTVGISVDRRGRIVFSGIPRLYAIDSTLKNNRSFFDNDKKVSGLNVITASDIDIVSGDTQTFIIPLRVGRNLDLVRVNAYDGSWTTIGSGTDQTFAWHVDRTGKPAIRLDTNRRGTELRVMTPEKRDSGQLRWKEALKIRLDRESQTSDDFSPIAPGPSPELYYVVGRPPGADRTGIHLYNLDTDTYVKEVFTHPKVDVERGITDPITGGYIGASYWDDRLEMTFVLPNLQAHYDGLSTFFGKDRNISFVESSEDRSIWLLATSGPRDPGSYHIYDMTKANSTFIALHNPRLKPDQLGPMQVVSWKARDGLDLTGYLTLPPNLPPGAKPPMVVLAHGGPEYRDTEGFDMVVQYLATRGYAVFQPNFRGSSGYGKAFAQAGRRQFGKAMQTDIADGVAHVTGLGLIDASRMCIMGASYGGYAALMGLVQFPELYKCAISASAPTDLLRQLKWERDEEGADSEAYKYWVSQIGDPKRDEAEVKAISPVNNVAAIRAPILLIHGRQDDTVPCEQMELMHKALTKAGKTVTMVEFKDSGHGFNGEAAKDYFQQVEAFLAKYLPVPLPAVAAN